MAVHFQAVSCCGAPIHASLISLTLQQLQHYPDSLLAGMVADLADLTRLTTTLHQQQHAGNKRHKEWQQEVILVPLWTTFPDTEAQALQLVASVYA